MKKMFLVTAILLLAAPAMANVTLTLTPVGAADDVNRGWLTLSYSADGNDVRAFALNITTDGGKILHVENLSSDYYVHPGSVEISGGEITGGEIVASSADYPDGTLPGLCDDAGATTEQGSLYYGEVNSPGGTGAGSSGSLMKLKVGDDCNVVVKVNAKRGGVVMEEPDEDPALQFVSGDTLATAYSAGPCRGDVSDSGFTKVKDGAVDIYDVQQVLVEMMNAYPSPDPTGYYEITPVPAWAEDMDITDDVFGPEDCRITIHDVQMILVTMMNAYPIPDPTGLYTIPCQ